MATSSAPAHLVLDSGEVPLHATATRDADHDSYAGFVTRTIAFALDAALINVAAIAVAAVVALVLSVFPVSHDMRSLIAAAGGVLFALWVVGYFVTFWVTAGETPGNHVMRVAVVPVDGGRLGWWRAVWRFAGLVLGLPLFVGYVPILLNDRRRGLQDVMGGTVVVNRLPDSNATPIRDPADEQSLPH